MARSNYHNFPQFSCPKSRICHLSCNTRIAKYSFRISVVNATSHHLLNVSLSRMSESSMPKLYRLFWWGCIIISMLITCCLSFFAFHVHNWYVIELSTVLDFPYNWSQTRYLTLVTVKLNFLSCITKLRNGQKVFRYLRNLQNAVQVHYCLSLTKTNCWAPFRYGS